MPKYTVRSLEIHGAQAAQWEEFIRRHDPVQGYALPAWLRIFTQSFGHSSHVLGAFNQEETLEGLLPLTHVRSALFGSLLCSLPFVNYGGILSTQRQAAEALEHAARELCQELGAASVELRHVHPCGLDLPSKADHKVSMVLDLHADADLLWKGFKDKVRNQVRKAHKNGLTVVRGGADLLDDFYAVFCVNMRDLGTPVYAKSFFAAVLEHLAQETEILCVYREGMCIAAGILYGYGTTMQMPWASSLLSHRNFCPNHCLYWEALRLSCEQGYAHFDFGRSTPNSGPWSFKKQWGVREVPLCWEYILPHGASMPALSVNNPKYQLAIRAWKKLPLWLANTLGPPIVRGIP